jgi:hypothetical protein
MPSACTRNSLSGSGRAIAQVIAEGRSESAQLFEEGVSEAEHDQMLRAAQEGEKSDESNHNRESSR